MSLPVFLADYDAVLRGQFPELAGPGQRMRITGPEAKHAVAVVRLKEGDELIVANGHGQRAHARVVATGGKDSLEVEIIDRVDEPVPEVTVTVAQALPKSERSELAVDLLTQAGADAIYAWEASRCVAKWQGAKREKGISKWRQAAIAAAKQSRRSRMPEITGPVSTAELAERLAEFDHVLVLHEEAATPMREVELDGKICVIIGPEGGLSEQEVATFQRLGARAVKLGPEVLRTASAGMVALAAIGVRTNRW